MCKKPLSQLVILACCVCSCNDTHDVGSTTKYGTDGKEKTGEISLKLKSAQKVSSV